jgi:hypothetical protein
VDLLTALTTDKFSYVASKTSIPKASSRILASIAVGRMCGLGRFLEIKAKRLSVAIRHAQPPVYSRGAGGSDRDRRAEKRYSTFFTGSDQTTRQSNQAAALILRSDGNAQEVFDSGFLEMSYQNAELSKPGSELCAAVAVMARENEVRHGW